MLALIQNNTFISQHHPGSRLDIDGMVVMPAMDGWSADDYSLVTIQPADPVPEGKRVVSTSVEMIDGQPRYAHVLEDEPVLTPEELRAAMPDLERWRVNTVIDLTEGLRDKINAAIDVMPEPERTKNRNKLADVVLFSRSDPLFDMLGSEPSIGLTPEQIDTMWQAALAL